MKNINFKLKIFNSLVKNYPLAKRDINKIKKYKPNVLKNRKEVRTIYFCGLEEFILA